MLERIDRMIAAMQQADGAAGGTAEPPAEGTPPPAPENAQPQGTGGKEPAPHTFTQSEVDAIIAQRLARKEKSAGGIQQPAAGSLLDELGEAERLASMTPEERTAYVQRRQQERQAQDMAERAAALTRREVRLEVASTLGELGLPAEIADAIDLSSQEASAQALQKLAPALIAWADKRSEARVLELTKGKAPPAGSPAAVDEIDFNAAFGIPNQ